jgi:hypothetical protein
MIDYLVCVTRPETDEMETIPFSAESDKIARIKMREILVAANEHAVWAASWAGCKLILGQARGGYITSYTLGAIKPVRDGMRLRV